MFPYLGYTGKWLYIDLTTRSIEKRDYDKEIAENYLGGNGFGTRLLWDEVGPEVDPLSPENLLIISAGPLLGTLVPNPSRIAIISKSPLTGIYGDTNSGGFLGPELKFAGWDAVVIKGKAESPVYLMIYDDRVEICDAIELWGLSASDTENHIRKQKRDPKIATAVIGPAGENLVRFAGVQITSQRSAARAGMGAVMGSKLIKAIAVRGSGPVRIAEPEKFHKHSLSMRNRLLEHPIYEGVTRFGTPGIFPIMNVIGRLPTRNFQQGSYSDADMIGPESLEDRAFVRHLSCFGCPVGCDKFFRIPNGPFVDIALRSVEYETLNSFGSGIDNNDIDALLAANRMCDDMGLDSISAGRVIGFAMELWEKEIINLDDTEGLNLGWGNMGTVLSLLELIALRKGFGNVLAEGVKKAAEIIGRGADQYAMHVKGMEIPGQDGRAQKSMGLAHATSTRGADHLKAFPTIDEVGDPYSVKQRWGEKYLPELAEPLATKYKPMLVKDGEDFGAVIDSVGMCKSGGTHVFAEFHWPDIATAIEYATGMEMPVERLKQIGERIYNLQRSYNAQHNITRDNDQLPKRFREEASPSGSAKGELIDLVPMLDEYYQLRNWDKNTGWPTPQKLNELGLSEAISRLDLLKEE